MQIYIAEDMQQTGPFDLDAVRDGLRTGKYAPTQLAWHEGAPDWEPISQLPGLEDFFAPPPPASSPVPDPSPEEPPAPSGSLPIDPAPYRPGAPVPGAGGGKRRPAWLLAGGVLLGLFAVAAGIIHLRRGPHPTDPPGGASYVSAPAPGSSPAAPNPDRSVAPRGAPASGTRRFTSNPAAYSGVMAAHFVAFSFDYPQEWTLQENAQDCYVVVQHTVVLQDGSPVSVESFSVSYAYSQPGHPLASALDTVGLALLNSFTAPLTRSSSAARQVPPRSGRFGEYAAEETLIADHAGPAETGIYYRCAIVPQQNDSIDGLGLTLISSDAAGCQSAEGVGDSGGLRTIQESFRFGP